MIGAIFAAAGSILGGNSKRKAARAAARGEILESESVAKIIRRKAREVRASATASLAASGVSVGDGTPLLIDAEIVARSEEDAIAALVTGKRRAKGLRKEGKDAELQGWIQAGSDIANGWMMMGT